MSQVTKSNQDGTVYFADNLRVIECGASESIAMTFGRMIVISHEGHAKPYDVGYGSKIYVKHGERVQEFQDLFQEDDADPIIADATGTLTLIDCIEGLTVARQVDETTGMSTLVVIKQQTKSGIKGMHKLRPRVLIDTGDRWRPCALLPVGTIVYRDTDVVPGKVLARIPK